MKRFKVAAAASLAIMVVAGCSSSKGTTTGGSSAPTSPAAATTQPATTTAAPPSTPTPARSSGPNAGTLSGTWDGHYSGGYSGTFTLTWTESGSSLSGTIKLSTPSETLPIHGALANGHISFGTVGSTAITYTGTVSGNAMSGQYQVAGGAGGSGSWSASKA